MASIMTKIGRKDKKTIKIVQKLNDEYKLPYTASILSYVLIERFLKEYIVKHKKDGDKIDLDFHKVKPDNSSILCLKSSSNKTKKEFINEFLLYIDLRSAEKIIRSKSPILKDYLGTGKKKRSMADPRNNIVHSNNFLGELRNLKTKERNEKINKIYEKAKQDLDFVIKNFSDIDT